MARNPMRDQVAIVGIGSTKYTRDGKRTPLALGLEAATKAILDAELTKKDIDGICGSSETVFRAEAGHLSLQGALDGPEGDVGDDTGWSAHAWTRRTPTAARAISRW